MVDEKIVPLLKKHSCLGKLFKKFLCSFFFYEGYTSKSRSNLPGYSSEKLFAKTPTGEYPRERVISINFATYLY